MSLSRLVLLSIAAVIHASTESEITPLNLTRCGDVDNAYFACHVEADCLYGPKQREKPMFLRRYIKAYHDVQDISSCKTVIVVDATPPDRPTGRVPWHEAFRPDLEVRHFTASGRIDKAHFSIGVRFLVGQKIVMLSEESGFTDDDDWTLGRYEKQSLFPVFGGEFNPVDTPEGIRFTLKSDAHDACRRQWYGVPYEPGRWSDKFYECDATTTTAAPPTTTTMTMASTRPLSRTSSPPGVGQPSPDGAATTMPAQPGETGNGAAAAPAANATAAADGAQPDAQQNIGAKSEDASAAAPVKGGLPVYVIVISVIAAIVCVVALGGAGYYWIRKRRRTAKKQSKSGSAQETDALIGKPNTESAPETETLISKQEANPEAIPGINPETEKPAPASTVAAAPVSEQQ